MLYHFDIKKTYLVRTADFKSPPFMKTILSSFLKNQYLLVLGIVLTFAEASGRPCVAQEASWPINCKLYSGLPYSLQVANDTAIVLQECLNMPALQKYYPRNADNTYKQVNIMQYPVSFPVNLQVSKFGMGILFKERGEIYSSKAEAFFIITTFLIEGNDATVEFDYNYKYTTTPKAIEVSLKMHKTGTQWSITSAITNHR
jgi:hypothetical protein